MVNTSFSKKKYLVAPYFPHKRIALDIPTLQISGLDVTCQQLWILDELGRPEIRFGLNMKRSKQSGVIAIL